MSIASFQINQVRPGGTSYGTADVARNDLWLGRQINLVSLAPGSHTYSWAFLDVPVGSEWGAGEEHAAEPLNHTAQTANFTPDVLGSYRVGLLVDNSVSEIMICAVRYDNLGNLQNRGWCYPALGEEVGEDNFNGSTRGWNGILDGIFNDILGFLQAGGSGVGVADHGTLLPGGPWSTLNFTGSGVSVAGGSGVATLTVSGGSQPWLQDCSAGGTVVYSGPETVPWQMTLTGTPAASFTLQIPTGDVSVAIANDTSQVAAVTSPGTEAGFIPPGDTAIMLGSADHAPLVVNGLACLSVANSDIVVETWPAGYGYSLFQVGVQNTIWPGSWPYLPLLGTMLSPRDAATYGVTAPLPGMGPVTTEGYYGAWYTSHMGWLFLEEGGAISSLCPAATYQNSPWVDQAMTVGNAMAPNCVGSLQGDSIAGTTESVVSLLPTFGRGTCEHSIFRFTLLTQLRISQSDTSADTVGDSWDIEQDYVGSVISAELVNLQAVGAARSSTPFIQAEGGSLGSVTVTLDLSAGGFWIVTSTEGCSTFDAGVLLSIAHFTDRVRTT